ncbi:MAG: HNH endonuclease, partial [Burkholderiaceae bacterium]
VPEDRQGGNWNTGYTRYDDTWFIFCNIGTAGTTGHNYDNHFDGDDLVWFAKNESHVGQPSIQSLLADDSNVLVFYREHNKDAFTFAGKARAVGHTETVPVQIRWRFTSASTEQENAELPEEVSTPELFIEGATRTVSVNAYERNPHARKACLRAHGHACVVCGFDFGVTYGELGQGYIHVHHLKQLADIGESYELDPVVDLRPVCPNCHAMLHRQRPPLSIEELRETLVQIQKG